MKKNTTKTPAQRGRASREKGKAYEREIAAELRAAGFTEARRTAQFCGKTGDASDVVGIPGVHIECKRREQIAIYDWMEQAETEAKPGTIPAVIFRKNKKESLVTLRLSDFLTVMRQREK